MDPYIGSGYDAIGTRQQPGQQQLEYYNTQSGLAFENPQMLANFVQAKYQNTDVNSTNVFDILKQGITSPTAVLNGAQQTAYDSIKASPTSDPALLREQANQMINSSVSEGQAKIQQYQTQLDSLVSQIASYFQVTPGEQALTKGLNNLDTSFEKGQNAIEDQAIPMEFITGQQAGNERRYIAQRNMMVRELQSETANRQQKLDAAKFLYDATRNKISDTIQLMQATAPDNIGSYTDERTGDMYVVMKNPLTGQTYTQNVGNTGEPAMWKENRALALQYGVTQPFYKVGQEIRNTATGQGYPTWEAYLAAGGKADLSNVQDISSTNLTERALVEDYARAYPDAGIALTDTLAQAQAKISSSAKYLDQIRPPSTGSRSAFVATDINPSGATITDTEVTKYAQQLISQSGGLNETNRWDLWGQVADELGPDAGRYDKLLWSLFHPEGLSGYNKYVLGIQPVNTVTNPFK